MSALGQHFCLWNDSSANTPSQSKNSTQRLREAKSNAIKFVETQTLLPGQTRISKRKYMGSRAVTSN